MRKSLLVLSATLALGLGTAIAQNCNSVINDETGTLTSSDTSAITTAANRLTDQGIMPHVIFAKGNGPTAAVEARYESACPNWKANGQRAANLLTFVVIPTARLKNVYFGGALTPAFGGVDAVNNRFSQAANPFFRQGNFGGGLAAAMTDFGKANAAFHDQAKHPVQQQVTEQATDLKPVTSMFTWLFILAFLAGGVILTIVLIRKRKAAQEEATAAQQTAQGAVQRADAAFRAADSTNPGYAEVAARYRDMSNSVTYDPNSANLSASAYATMAAAWNDVASDFRSLRTPSAAAPISASPVSSSVYDIPLSAPRSFAAAASASNYGSRSYDNPPTPQPTVIHETTYVDRGSSNDGLLTGMLIGESLDNSDREERREAREEREERDYDRPSYRDPEPAREESSGSDSSWASSSSDDDSSSGSDSSSSFDSSSSDSGSGSDSSW